MYYKITICKSDVAMNSKKEIFINRKFTMKETKQVILQKYEWVKNVKKKDNPRDLFQTFLTQIFSPSKFKNPLMGRHLEKNKRNKSTVKTFV